MKFIDLFSGIGGFHTALSNNGCTCVFSSEIDKDCIEVYRNNYGMESGINVRDVKTSDIPDFDVLCGGFPCVTFSKAGKQAGMNDTRGTLFFEIQRILEDKRPKYVMLENVRNLVSHDNGNTWKVVTENLTSLGYRLTKDPIVLSPHQFGVPQLRERVFILGYYDPEHIDEPLEININKTHDKDSNSIYTILDPNEKGYKITKEEEKVLNIWDEFYKGIQEKTLGFPVWLDYMTFSGDLSQFPMWKQEFIRKNQNLYQNNKKFIDKWLKKHNNLEDLTPTQRKFEYQAGTEIDTIWEGVIQFRPSGIRVKRPTCFPALVAMVQIPIIGRYKRRLSVRECGRLQSFPESFKPCENTHQAYKQFGNSVNVKIIELLYNELIKYK